MAAIHARPKRKEIGVDPNLVLTRYAVEWFLYRLSWNIFSVEPKPGLETLQASADNYSNNTRHASPRKRTRRVPFLWGR